MAGRCLPTFFLPGMMALAMRPFPVLTMLLAVAVVNPATAHHCPREITTAGVLVPMADARDEYQYTTEITQYISIDTRILTAFP